MCERLLALLQEQQEVTLGMTFLDGTNIKNHHKATGTSKKGSFEERDHRKALGRACGSYGSKVCVIADRHAKALGFVL